MSALLHRLGAWCSGHAWRVLSTWFALLFALVAGLGAVGINLDDAFRIEGAESVEGMEILQERLPQAAGTNDPVLLTATDGTIEDHRAAIEDFIVRASAIDGIAMVTDPFADQTYTITEDSRHALIQVMGDKSVGSQSTGPTPKAAETAAQLRELVDEVEASSPGLDLQMGGNIGHFITVSLSVIELIGVAVAALVLLATFGSLLAAGAPLVAAVISVGVGIAGILLLATVVDINSTTPVLAVMIGLAVGIDYALFIISRAREYLRVGTTPREAAARAVATAGSAVVFAGGTVIVALCGLAVTGIPFLAVMGMASAAVVAIAVAVAITAVPALLGLIGLRALPKAQRASARIGSAPRPRRGGAGKRRTPARWWIETITRLPALTTVLVTGVLALAAYPATAMTTGLTDNGYEPEGSPLRTTYDAIGEVYGEGYNAPIVVIAEIAQSTDPLRTVADLEERITALSGVASVALATPNPDATLAFVQVIPEKGQTDPATTALVEAIREAAPAWEAELSITDIMVTGQTAVAIDVATLLDRALLPFGIVVVGLSLLLLLIVFRSVAVPLTATLGYILSLGAAFGSIGAVFGLGWGAELLGVTKTGAVISFMPVMVMGILFGLAMDYQVFLVSRMREEWIHTGNAARSVRSGFVGSATVVTAAAVIMTSVFAAFIPHGSVQIKPIAVALTAGIAADAFLVRMTLIPAVMAWLGKRAWWIPTWLDRLLPVVDVEGEGLARSLEHSDWVRQHGPSMIRIEDLSVREASLEVIDGFTLTVRPGALAVVRSEDPLVRRVLAAVVAARLRPSAGRVVIDHHVLPDGTYAVQGMTQILRDWDEPVPHSARLVIVDNPGSRRWRRVATLLSSGVGVLVTGPSSLQVPPDVRPQAEAFLPPATSTRPTTPAPVSPVPVGPAPEEVSR